MKLKWAGLPLAALLLAPASALAARHHHSHHAAMRHAVAVTASSNNDVAAIDLVPTPNPDRAAPVLLAAGDAALIPTANPMRAPVVTLAAATAVNLTPTPNPIEQVQLTDAVPLPDISSAAPIVQWPLQKLSCVPYARLRSGFAIFGDARLWWEKAKNVYAQLTQPVADAVMVFAGTRQMTHGHVAVVTQIVNAREIKVDHANWQNKGEIDLNMPVLDVSANNDWSQVRVWNVNTHSFGGRVYPVSGFITRAKTANLAP